MNRFIRVFAFALLYAVLQTVIPVHEILHTHKESRHTSHHLTEIQEYEKPCCKPANYFHLSLAILAEQDFVFRNVSFFYKEYTYTSYHHKIIANPSNKAPPVEIA
ncbi:hypothetical protein [Pseudopedobacter sp.]|uniref:hypothetical protein n=1 Tax=Pseudopedobacter sp. TaxID=1936787 RepID=UPI0033423837